MLVLGIMDSALELCDMHGNHICFQSAPCLSSTYNEMKLRVKLNVLSGFFTLVFNRSRRMKYNLITCSFTTANIINKSYKDTYKCNYIS